MHPDVIDSSYLDLGSKLTQVIDSLVDKDIQEEIYFISTYSSKPKPPLITKYITFLDEIEDEIWFESFLRTEYARDYVLTTTKGLKRECISIISPVFSFERDSFFELLGIMKVDILLPIFFQNALLDKGERVETGIYVFSSDGNLVFSQPCCNQDTDSIWNLISSEQAQDNSDHVIRFQKSGFLIFPPFQEFDFRCDYGLVM